MVVLVGYILMDITTGTIVEKPAAVVSLFFFLLATAALFYPEEEQEAEARAGNYLRKRLAQLESRNNVYRKTLEAVRNKKPEEDGWCRAAKYMREEAEYTLENYK